MSVDSARCEHCERAPLRGREKLFFLERFALEMPEYLRLLTQRFLYELQTFALS